ncbi:MAG: hypothetical protein HKO93_04690 [Flavobacteriales bacterium]|nr:hypothetical protein [Flavobacteriales bacterium]
MIKFFRNIRQRLLTENRFSKYMLYAFGEILLVVIGIIIALQINNWNSERLKNDRNHKLLVKLSSELELNIERATLLDSIGFGNLSDRETLMDSVITLLNNNMLADYTDYVIDASHFWVNTLNLNTAVFEELKNTGSLYSIGSDSLVTEIQRYYQLCERESFYNLDFGEKTDRLRDKCLEGWFDFKYLYQRNPEEAVKHHPWIKDPRSQQYIHFRQFITSARFHSYLMSMKLKGLMEESEKLKELIDLEINS